MQILFSHKTFFTAICSLIMSFFISSTAEYILAMERFEGPPSDACYEWEIINKKVLWPLNLQCGRVGSRPGATSKMEFSGMIVHGWKSLTIITESSILDVAAALDPPLQICFNVFLSHQNFYFLIYYLSHLLS